MKIENNGLQKVRRNFMEEDSVIVKLFIISMTKLVDADWLRGVQLFH